MSIDRQRLDQLLVKRGIVASRSRAQAQILAGEVYVDGVRRDKSGLRVHDSVEIEIRSARPDYVSRGGTKLAGALAHFSVDVAGSIALDVGCSTGGFTDCLLQNGADKVYAVDVGRGQLDWKLRNDARVVVREGLNARYLTAEDIPELVDLAVVDVSFISLAKVLRAVLDLLKPSGMLLPMVKPQFEVGRGEVGKGGVVRDKSKHEKVLQRISGFIYTLGAAITGVTASPILGPKGNREFFLKVERSGERLTDQEQNRLIGLAVYGKQ